MLCKYKDSLGIPGKGVHTHFMGIAIEDVLMTILGSELIVLLFGTPRVLTFVSVVLTGIVLHRLFCVRTTIDKYLFP
jgi:hypothetical protein